MSSNNTPDTKCDKTPAGPPQLTFLMESMSILASLGLNLVWFTFISKLTDGPHPDYDQGCRPGQPLRGKGEGGGGPTGSSLDDHGTQPPGPPWLSLVPDGN